MNINISSLLVIMFAVLVLILNIRSIYSIKNISPRKKKIILSIRLVLIILIVLGTTGLSIISKSKSVHTIFLVDRSSSISSEKSNVELFINDAINRKGRDDKISIISFAADISTDYTSFDEKRKIKLNTIVNKNATNYEMALEKANSLILNKESGRVVLISDGLGNQGDYIKLADKFKEKNIEFKFVKINSNHDVDSQISNMKIPKDIRLGESFQIELDIYSTRTSSAILRIYKGSDIFSEKKIKLSKGKNNFIYKDTLYKSGNQIYRAEVDLMGDLYANNNRFSSMTNAIGSPRILVVDDGNLSGDYISNLARDNSFEVDNYNLQALPSELKNLLRYQAIVLNNVSLEQVSSNFIKSLKIYVEDYGGGLFVTGGDKSYALGGYYKTELEDILPVNMEMKRDGILPSVSMLLIVDRSGSMNGKKMDMAKEAARKAVDAMKPNDSMAILAFDDSRAWVSRLRTSDKKDEIIDSISSIKSGGGTSILPALSEGINELKTSDSKLKHIILLTDGQAETTGYDTLIEDAIGNEITISTIALGIGSDIRLLEYIANEGKGRFYNVIDPTNIPKVFTKESFLASKSYINEEIFTPIITSDSSLARPLYSENYDLMGYVSTSIKSNAELILKTDKDEPLLASWYYGLGKVSAWTSDAGGVWTSKLLSSDAGKLMTLNILNDILISNNSKDINISTSQEGSNVNIVVGKEDLSTATVSDEIIIIDKDGKESPYTGEIYNNQFVKAKLTNMEEGLYIIKTSAVVDSKIIYEISPLLVNYSSEYNLLDSEDVSVDIVEKFDGDFIEESNEVFTSIESKVYDSKDYSNLILILAIFVFILDVYVKRFRNDKFTSFVEKINSKINIQAKKNNHQKLINKKNNLNKNAGVKKILKEENAIDKEKDIKNTKIKDKKKSSNLKEPSDMDHLNRLLKAKDKRK